jgi:UDP-glucose 4-epimerase
MSQVTALVTGAAGFIGSHLAERLLAADYTVIGLDCFTNFYSRPLKENNLSTLRASPRFCFVEADLNACDLRALLAQHDVRYIFHVAGQAGVRPSWGLHFQDYVANNVLATQALLEAASQLPDPRRIERFVFASSSSVYGEAERLPTSETDLPQPVSPYGVTKLAAEHLCMLYARERGLPVVALRYFSVYGPRQRPDMGFYIFIRALLNGEPLRVLGDGEQTREFTYVDDIVEANLRALDAPRATGNGNRGQVYNIGGGSRVTLNAALETLAEVVGRAPRIEYVARAAGDHRHGAADISRARRELNYAPRVGLEQGLRQQVEWQRALL